MNNNKIESIIKDYSLERTSEDNNLILDFKRKAIESLSNIFGVDLESKESILFSEKMQPKLAQLGFILNQEDILENPEEIKNNEILYDSLMEEISEDLGLEPIKKEEDVLLNENLIKEEVVKISNTMGANKEVVLEGAFQAQNGMVASSLVVDAEKKDIEKVIKKIDDKFNPKPKFEKSKKKTNKEKEHQKYVDDYLAKQNVGIVLEEEKFNVRKTILEPIDMINFKTKVNDLRSKSLSLEDRPVESLMGNGSILERKPLKR